MVAQTFDGGYAVVGEQAIYQPGGLHTTGGWINKTALLIKTDKNGNLEWEKAYIGLTFERGGATGPVIQTSDNGFALFGFQKNNLLLVKTDSKGNVQWNVSVELFGYTLVYTGIQTSDGNYLLAGANVPEDGSNSHGWVLKLDSVGNVLWDQTFGVTIPSSTIYVDARVVAQAFDGNYLVAGNWRNDCWFAKLDTNGNLLWNRTFDFKYDNDEVWFYRVTCIACSSDGGYVLGGWNGDRAFLIKTNSEGVMEWNRPYADNTALSSIAEDISGEEYFGAGRFEFPGNTGAWFAVFNSVGDLLWDQTIDCSDQNGDQDCFVRSVIATSDGGYAATGAFNSTVWLVKFAPETATTPENPPDFLNSVFFPIIAGVTAVIIIAAVVLVWHRRSGKFQKMNNNGV
ncbi:MAG: hypothetical protein ACQCN3_14450 [Candidatus Bathyarchaeia archaeon]